MLELLASTAAAFVVALLRGLALAVLWRWFACPLGLPSIGVFQAAGLMIIAAVFTVDANAPPAEVSSLRSIGNNILFAAILTGLGGVLHLFMGLI